MNSHISPMSYKKYSLLLIVALLTLAIATWILEAYFGTLHGDLTRIGYLDERDFGWNMQQPLVPAEHLKNYSPAEADILVIGDSFSMSLVWQSRLASSGYKISTLNWSAFKPCGLGLNLGEVIRKAGFKGRYIVVENIEHSFQDRANRICDITGGIRGSATDAAPPPTSLSAGEKKLAYQEPLGGNWVLNALLTKIKLAYFFSSTTPYMEFGNATYRTRVIPIDGCDLFSNKLCNYGLFYGRDFQKKTFGPSDNLLSINRELRKVGITAVWLVVPDKSSVYLGYGKQNINPYVDIWSELARHTELVAPNLGDAFTKKSRLIKDFYKPNDVHLSTNGFLYLGDLMTDLIKHLEHDTPPPGDIH